MDRDQFIKVLEGCIESATGRHYPDIDFQKLSNQGLIQCAEMIRDLLERRVRARVPEPVDGRLH